ncbi:MAG: MFS transporter [Omnitrophica WOR_2 bacterium]
MAGGDWAIGLPQQVRKNLSWFWSDGFFAAASDNITLTYLVVYILTLGGTGVQIGFMTSISNLNAALLLLPGALLVERIGHRKQITLLGGSANRVLLIFLALIPFLLSGPALVYCAMALSILRDAFTYLGFPAWMSFTADIVPLEGRGRFFASRNFAMGVSGMVVTLFIGILITRMAKPDGYQAALLIAFFLGLGSILSYSHIIDPFQGKQASASSPLSFAALFKDLRGRPDFLILIYTTALWNLALNIAGPFFTVYLVQNLKATAAMVGITTIASSLTTFLFQRKLGVLADRWGPLRMQILSSLIIPILPVAWIFTRAAWNVIPINLLSGFLWGAFNLASFNYLLMITPEDQRARYAAIYQVVVLLSLSAGAAIGGLVVSRWGYIPVFFISGIGRLTAAILFARYSRHPLKLEKPAPAR